MNKRTAVYTLIASLFILLLMQLTASSPSIAPITSGSTILCFGDSLTFGTGADKPESYTANLKKKFECNVINAGIPGELTSEGARRLPRELKKYEPQLLILCEGGNDFLRRKPKDKTKANLDKMINMAISKDIDVILVGVPKPGITMTPPDLYKELADKYNLPLEGDILPDVLSDSSLKSDYAHPNTKGYKLIADAIYELIQDSIKQN